MQFSQNVNHKNFHFTQIPGKTNDVIFLKSPKTVFWAIFDHFWSILPNGDFFQKIRLCHTQLYMDPQHQAKFQKKLMSQFRENIRTDGRKDGRMDRPYFIGPVWPRPGVQKLTEVFIFTLLCGASKAGVFIVDF